MTTTKQLGILLVSIENALSATFQDDACITSVEPSVDYEKNGTLLDITISVFKSRYDEDAFEMRMSIFDNLIYNPTFNTDYILTKVNIKFEER